MIRCQVGRRTNGSNSRSAKQARQKTRAAPRVSRGHPSSNLVCVKKPLLLQSTAARTTRIIPEVVGCVLRAVRDWLTDDSCESIVALCEINVASGRCDPLLVGNVLFDGLFKVGLCRRKLEAKIQFCTNESPFAKGDVLTYSVCFGCSNGLHSAGVLDTSWCRWSHVGRANRAVRNPNLVGVANLLVAAEICAICCPASVATRCDRSNFMATCIARCSNVANAMNTVAESRQKVWFPSLTACASSESQQQAGRN